MRSSVVLPEPEGPSSAKSSPAATRSDTSWSAGVSPNRFTTFSMVTSIGVPSAMAASVVAGSTGFMGWTSVSAGGSDLSGITPF